MLSTLGSIASQGGLIKYRDISVRVHRADASYMGVSASSFFKDTIINDITFDVTTFKMKVNQTENSWAFAGGVNSYFNTQANATITLWYFDQDGILRATNFDPPDQPNIDVSCGLYYSKPTNGENFAKPFNKVYTATLPAGVTIRDLRVQAYAIAFEGFNPGNSNFGYRENDQTYYPLVRA